jgi:hypothetical protein
MNSKTALLSAVLSALALIASGASAATRTETAPALTQASALTTLAKHGADDPVGSEDPGCDDRGTDLCAYKLSKHGADDAVGDDNGVDFIIGKHGADDAVGDDNGVDFIIGKHGADDAADPFDDNGVDVILAKHGADDLVDGEDDHGVDFILG